MTRNFGCLWTPLLATLLALLGAGIAAASGGGGDGDPSVLVGPVDREAVESAVPAWVSEEELAEVDPEAAAGLARVEPGAQVTVYLGTWCSDSRRELARLWRAFDEVPGRVPFEITYIAVDRDKAEPAALVEGSGLAYVPTFIVRRDGRELGRIVEESPAGIEHDLLALLTGRKEGVVSARPEMAGGGEEP